MRTCDTTYDKMSMTVFSHFQNNTHDAHTAIETESSTNSLLLFRHRHRSTAIASERPLPNVSIEY